MTLENRRGRFRLAYLAPHLQCPFLPCMTPVPFWRGEANRISGVDDNNVGGRHSDTDLLKWGNRDIPTLLAASVKLLSPWMSSPSQQNILSGEMEISAWANVF